MISEGRQRLTVNERAVILPDVPHVNPDSADTVALMAAPGNVGRGARKRRSSACLPDSG
jgi:hypothetical protein